MTSRFIAAVAVTLLLVPSFSAAAYADNKMGYKMESAEQAAGLQRSGGSLGMRVGPQQQITSGGLTFQVLKVEAVNDGSPAAQAGLTKGDQIIAVNGRVFPNTKTFAEYVGSVAPGEQINIDYMPANAGPEKAQRVGVTVGEKGKAVAPKTTAPSSTQPPASGDASDTDASSSPGLSTGQKVAIGLGAAAIFGCYEFNCFAKLKKRFEQERQKHSQPAPQPH